MYEKANNIRRIEYIEYQLFHERALDNHICNHLIANKREWNNSFIKN